MDISIQFEVWKKRFENTDVFKNYNKPIRVFEEENLIVYRFMKSENDWACFKIDCWGGPLKEYDFSVWTKREEDEFFPLTEEGFSAAIKYLQERLWN